MADRSGWGRAQRLRLTGVLAAVAVLGGLAACTGDDSGSDGGDDSGATVGSGDRYEAQIRRTTDGVAHITGDSLVDVSYGQGYASGQDRPCDLVEQVLKIRGERARWFGPGEEDANIDSDVAWRTIGIFDRATADWDSFPDDSVELVTAFVDGWNAQLDEVGADGVDGWCKGADWLRPVEPVELYAYARSVALLASGGTLARYIPSARPPGTPEPEPVATSTTTTTPSTTPPSTSTMPATTTEPNEHTSAPGGATPTDAPGLAELARTPLASNGWAVGSERSEDGGGLLVGNPHFPWEGELRFWESHLTVPGELDMYGVQLSGLPGIGIGFTEDFGWTHTVSAGNRFTAYRLALVPGSPTSYRYGDEVRQMTPVQHRIEVLGDDGEVSEVERTTWTTHWGPIIDLPGFGWSEQAAITYRDANIDNDEFLQQYLDTMTATSLDDLQEVNRTVNGVPLFNTIAASSDGRAWYADTSATPNLSAAAIAAYEAALVSDPITKLAADNGAVLLDGSDPTYEWVDAPGARDPGLVPPDRQPQLERTDYVFNANDSFWLANAQQLLEGDYSPLHGRQETARSPRTRENAVVLDDTSATGPAGADGRFTLDEIADASLANEGYTARALRSAVVERCRAATGPVAVEELAAGADDVPGLPAATVDIAPACSVLAAWDGRYDLDSVGAALWRELMARYEPKQLTQAGALWAEPFDPARPVETPSGLAPAPAGAPDPLLVNLARAVQSLEVAGFAPDVPLGDVQFALRDGERIPIHGGNAADGTTNVVSFAASSTSRDPEVADLERDRLVRGSTLSSIDDERGYPVNYGTSFLFAVRFGDDGPTAKAFLTYGNTGDRTSDQYTEVTERFSQKNWRDVAFTEKEIERDQIGETLTVKG